MTFDGVNRYFRSQPFKNTKLESRLGKGPRILILELIMFSSIVGLMMKLETFPSQLILH